MNGLKLLLISSIGLCGMHVVGVAVGGLFQFFFSQFWLHWITVVSFFVIGVILIYLGITEEPDKEEFDDKMKEIEQEMIEKSSIFSDEYANEHLNNEDNFIAEKDNEANSHHKEKKESTFWKYARMLLFNEAIKIIATII